MHHGTHKDPAAERRALQAVEHHHAEMLGKLRELVATLVRAVEERDSNAEHHAQEELLAWCQQELIPHALAEEGPLYGGPRKALEGRLLVEGMLAEHKAIVRLVEQLSVSRGVKAAVTGGVIEELFALHLDKENKLLMPFIADSAELSLASAVEGLHELVGETHTHAHDHKQS
jgi:hypothetical protein